MALMELNSSSKVSKPSQTNTHSCIDSVAAVSLNISTVNWEVLGGVFQEHYRENLERRDVMTGRFLAMAEANQRFTEQIKMKQATAPVARLFGVSAEVFLCSMNTTWLPGDLANINSVLMKGFRTIVAKAVLNHGGAVFSSSELTGRGCFGLLPASTFLLDEEEGLVCAAALRGILSWNLANCTNTLSQYIRQDKERRSTVKEARTLLSNSFSLDRLIRLSTLVSSTSWSVEEVRALEKDSEALLSELPLEKETAFADVALILWTSSFKNDGYCPNFIQGQVMLNEGRLWQKHGAGRFFATVMSLTALAVLLHFKGNLKNVLEAICTALFLVNWWILSYRSSEAKTMFSTRDPYLLEEITSRLESTQAFILQFIVERRNLHIQAKIELTVIATSCKRFSQNAVSDLLEEQIKCLL